MPIQDIFDNSREVFQLLTHELGTPMVSNQVPWMPETIVAENLNEAELYVSDARLPADLDHDLVLETANCLLEDLYCTCVQDMYWDLTFSSPGTCKYFTTASNSQGGQVRLRCPTGCLWIDYSQTKVQTCLYRPELSVDFWARIRQPRHNTETKKPTATTLSS